KIKLDWLGWIEERVMLVAALKGWDVILRSPSLKHVKAVINMGTMTVSIQPPEHHRFILTQWIPVPATKKYRKKPLLPLPSIPETELENQITSAATIIQTARNPFDEFPDIFPEAKNLELPPLRQCMDHHINLK